jgi:beta-galactosidase
MRQAGFNLVRLAEFAWDRLEPQEAVFDFDFFDHAIALLGEHGVQTMLCTPTAAPPRWLTLAYPDVHRQDARGVPLQHGARQHCCHTNLAFRAHSRRITQAMADHYRDNPNVVSWQTDNEFHCHFSECHCPACQQGFQDYLSRKFGGDIDTLNRTWGTTFWAQTYTDFAQIPTPKPDRPCYDNPAHRLDYYRFLQESVAVFQHEQVAILRAANPDWQIIHNGCFRHIDYRGLFGQDLDALAYDVYPFFDPDHGRRPYSHAFNLDRIRALTGNFVIPEHQSGGGGQAGYLHDTPEPNELRRMTYTSIARGADSLLYFRWRTCRFGAEEYWRGILDHDSVPRRRYAEVSRIGQELGHVGPRILGTHVRVDIGIAMGDVDVLEGHDILSLGLPNPKDVAQQIHEHLNRNGYAVGCVHPADSLQQLKLYIVPHWAMFDPEWVPALERFVEAGGTLVVGARTGTKDMANNVVAETPPGCLTRLVGASVVEYSRQNCPEQRRLGIACGSDTVETSLWCEVLALAEAEEWGTWTGRYLTGEPAISHRQVGKGHVYYVGTILTGDVWRFVWNGISAKLDLAPLWPAAPPEVEVVVRTDGERRVWFLMNRGDDIAHLSSTPKGMSLTDGKVVSGGHHVLAHHDVLIIEEQ